MKKKLLGIIPFLFSLSFSYSQTTTIAQAGASCYDATIVLNKNQLVVSSTANGYSSTLKSKDYPSCFTTSKKVNQATFLKFTTTDSAGTIEFTITPNISFTEIDWVLYRLTGCSDRVSGIQAVIACSDYNNHGIGSSGTSTGMRSFGSFDDTTSFIMDAIDEKNQQYILMVENRNADGNGYTIDWGGTFTLDYLFNFPNAFSPNGDGKFDSFVGQGRGVDIFNYNLIIIDRLGKIVFQSSDPYEKWTGEIGNNSDDPCANGLYVYRAVYSNTLGDAFNQTGTIALIR